jgi:hypothetical protein
MLDDHKFDEYDSLCKLVKPQDRESIHQRLSVELNESGELQNRLKKKEIEHYHVKGGQQGFGFTFVKGVKSTIFDFYIMIWDGDKYNTFGCNAKDVSQIINSFQENPFMESTKTNDEHRVIKKNYTIATDQ